MISTLVGSLNLVLGLVYLGYGLMTIDDLRRSRGPRTRSHFAYAWIAMAFTCGPHHLEHGLHVLTTELVGGGLDLLAVVVGAPAAVIWFLLRLEARGGGRGDRSITGTPPWLEALPTLGAIYLVGFTTAALLIVSGTGRIDVRLLPNALLVGLYVGVGWVLGRTQARSRRLTGRWSLSGLSLATVFPTCALMHATWIVYVASGAYVVDRHLLVIDTLSVPAAIYFLWVMAAIGSGRLTDGSTAADDARGATAEPVTAADGATGFAAPR